MTDTEVFLPGGVVVAQEGVYSDFDYAALLERYDDLLYLVKDPVHADLVLDSSVAVMDLLVERGLPARKSFRKKLEKAPLDVARRFLLLSAILGRWQKSVLETERGVFVLLDSLTGGPVGIIRAWFHALEDKTPQRLVSSLLTFLVRLRACEALPGEMSRWMRKAAYRLGSLGVRVSPAAEYLYLAVPLRLRVLAFMLALRGNGW